jgi:hypothetical protein
MVNLAACIHHVSQKCDLRDTLLARLDSRFVSPLSISLHQDPGFSRLVPHLYIGPMISVLCAAEIEAIIAHEIAHIQLGHLRYRRYRVTYWAARYFSPIMLSISAKFLAKLETSASFRQKEFDADHYGSKLTNADCVASLLLKFYLVWNHYWMHVNPNRDSQIALRCLNEVHSLSSVLQESLSTIHQSGMQSLKRGKVSCNTSVRHPTSSERIRNLGLTFDETLANFFASSIEFCSPSELYEGLAFSPVSVFKAQ